MPSDAPYHHDHDWLATKLDGFLSLNDRNILDHGGKISHQMAKHRQNKNMSSLNSSV